jgi:hypothetical protein
MNRRSFLQLGAALAGGVALRSVPVLGQNYSELVPVRPFALGSPYSDDWHELQRAIDRTPFMGTAAFDPSRVYRVNAPLKIKSHMTFTGANISFTGREGGLVLNGSNISLTYCRVAYDGPSDKRRLPEDVPAFDRLCCPGEDRA